MKSGRCGCVLLPRVAGQTAAPENFNYQLLDMELDRVEAVRAENLLHGTDARPTFQQQSKPAKRRRRSNNVIVPSPAGQLAPEGGPIEPFSVQVMRPPEPTITPQTMRAGFQQYIEARFAEQTLSSFKNLLTPRNG